MKRLLAAMMMLALLLPLAGCEGSADIVNDKNEDAEATEERVVENPYREPDTTDAQALIWYGDGEHYSFPNRPAYKFLSFPDEYISHEDTLNLFDDGPDDKKWSSWFGSVLTGKAPVENASIVLFCWEHVSLYPWESNELNALVYDVSVDDELKVTLGETRFFSSSSDDAGVDLYFECVSDAQDFPMAARTNFMNEEDDGFHISDMIGDGTPYDQRGVIYDRFLLEMQRDTEHTALDDGYATGGGSTYYRWNFMPICPGESDILLVTYEYVPEKLAGVMVHAAVDSTMHWTLDWFIEGYLGEDFRVYVSVDGEEYTLDAPYTAEVQG